MAELIAGISLGFAAGVSPGPLLTLVVVSALERGFGAGARVAVAPLITDSVVILLVLAVLTNVSDGVVTALGIGGGVYLIVLGVRTLVQEPSLSDEEAGGRVDLMRGVVANFASPHPWIFWFTVGGPFLVNAWDEAPWRGVAFLIGFYTLLVGSKLVIAWVVGRTRHRLPPVWRVGLIRVGGGLLVVAGIILIVQQV